VNVVDILIPRVSATGSSAAAARLETWRDDDCLAIALGGLWTTREIDRQDRDLAAIAPDGAARAEFHLGELEEMDTAGAWLIYRTRSELEAQGLAVTLTGGNPHQLTLIDTVASHHEHIAEPPPPATPLVSLVNTLGHATIEILKEARDLINFLGLTVIVLLRSLARPRTIRTHALFTHMEQAGLHALPIVGLISFLIGVVLAYQGAEQLARFGAEIFTVNLVGFGVLREMGILLTAIIVAGRSGSAYTAQIGTMKVNEEIDAMRTIGLDPMEVLVIPRVLALVLVLPLLTFYADMMGLLGGAVIMMFTLDLSLFQYARVLNSAVEVGTFWVGIIKAPVFAFIIAMVGCYEGLKVSRSAESVGLRTTTAVVEGIFLVIVLDAMFSVMFALVGL
jgi:phospholipid/cholesterol/gamma-HCH transport system permease protein